MAFPDLVSNNFQMEEEMETVLRKVGLEACLQNFLNERISPDLVCKLSMPELNMLGVYNSSDMMKLRTECIKYGPMKNQTSSQEPKYNIPKEVIESLLQSGFRVHEIAKLLSVSERTVYRRMSKYDVSVYEFSDIDDENLETEVARVTTEFPRVGESMIRQILQQRGIKVYQLCIYIKLSNMTANKIYLKLYLKLFVVFNLLSLASSESDIGKRCKQ